MHQHRSSRRFEMYEVTDGRIRCPACAALNAPDALSCTFCRTWLVATARCGRCTGVFLTRIESCSSCGASLAAALPLSSVPPELKRRDWRSQRTIIAATTVALLVSVGVAVGTGHLALWDGITLVGILLTLAGGLTYLAWDTTVGPFQTVRMTNWGDQRVPGDGATRMATGRQDDRIID